MSMFEKPNPRIIEIYLSTLNEVAPPIRKGVDIRNIEWIDRAREGLENILVNCKKRASQKDIGEESFARFVITGHAETETNVEGDLTGWFSGPLSPKGIRTAELQTPEYNSLVLSSDLPRVIEHTLRKYYSHETEIMKSLDPLIAQVRSDMQKFDSGISNETYRSLVSLALENGIIPTPLLRAQYFGPLELFISKFGGDREQLNAAIIRNVKEKLIAEGKEDADAVIQDLIAKAKERKDIVKILRDEFGITVSENYITFFNRSAENVFGLLEKYGFRNVDIVGHSGFFDVAMAYFRHKQTPKELHIVRTPTPPERGQVLNMKLDEDYTWLNDPQRLEPIIEATEREIDLLRGLSVDRLIKESRKGIVETLLVGFKKEEGKKEYEPYPETIRDALSSPDPIIIFGHGGQGKSILATGIAKTFLEGAFGEEYAKYIPIILNCEELNKGATGNRKAYGESRIESLIREQVDSQNLPSQLLQEYKFVFIIDDYQKLGDDYVQETTDTIKTLRQERNLVIVLSRLERTDVHPPHNPGYKTMQIDTNTIAEQTDEFLEHRIKNPEDANRFKEYLRQYDSSITGFYLTKLFLTMIFPTEDNENEGLVEYVINPAIAQAIREGKPLTRTQLYEAQTDYVTGCDIERQYPNLVGNISAVREKIGELKAQLAEKAFRDIFGPET